jgi:photosystem I P700 chlorophyll a apoprotein A2
MFILGFHSDSFISLHQISSPRQIPAYKSNGRSATNRYFQVMGGIHDIESYFSIDNALSLNAQIFSCHFGHLAVIFAFVAAELFHIGWNGNFSCFLKNPIASLPIAHGIGDPHFSYPISSSAYSSSGSYYGSLLSFSGIYNWLYAVGFTTVFDIYNFVIACELLAVAFITSGNLHLIYSSQFTQWLALNVASVFSFDLRWGSNSLTSGEIKQPTLKLSRPRPLLNSIIRILSKKSALHTKVYPIFIWPYRLFSACFDSLSLVNFSSLSSLMTGFALISGAWSAHLIHLNNHAFYTGDMAFYTGDWSSYETVLTFLGGLRSDTASLYLTDIAHHHLAIALLFLWQHTLSSSLYRAFRSLSISSIVAYYSPVFLQSLHLHLSLGLAIGGSLVAAVATSLTSLTPYPYLSYDYLTTTALNLHHSSIALSLMIGSFAHAGIFLVRDWSIKDLSSYLISRILAHKAAIISHLTWVVAWLALHTLGVYVHNDTVFAFGSCQRALLIEPVFAQIVQEFSGKALYGTQSVGLAIRDVNKSFGSLISPSGPGDLLAGHAIALGLHLTTLILLKGSLDARRSKLMPDKIHVGFHFACDGPARSGTCDISAWDSVYLATFWSLNTGAWAMFYFHWKHITLWQNAAFQFSEGSSYLNAWFRSYLWFNSAPLIGAYDALGVNDLSVWAWIFLAAHLCWATGFMFLISWRGYWQELIDIILYMHLKTPILYDLFSGGVYTPVALSIVQARFIGLVHFSVGFILTYAAFIIAATS